MKYLTRSDYHAYIQSPAWLNKHPRFLQRSKHRCAALPLFRLGRVKSMYHRYRIHHAHYNTLGGERFALDAIPLCPFAHNHIVHGILSGYKTPSQQDESPNRLDHYPNLLQRGFHFYCRLNLLLIYLFGG